MKKNVRENVKKQKTPQRKAEPAPAPSVLPVVDLHCDSTYNIAHRNADLMKRTRHQLDIPKLKQGGINVQFFVIWAKPDAAKREGFYQFSLNEAQALHRFFEKNADAISPAYSARDISKITSSGKIAAVLAIEGAHSIDDENVEVVLSRLREFYDYGARYMSITWNNSNRLGVSAFEAGALSKRRKGLSDAGKQVAREMLKLGMLLDVSHVSEDTFRDMAQIAQEYGAPIIASHSNARALCNHVRNLTDEQIKTVAESGGVIGVNFIAVFLRRGGRKAGVNVSDVVKHINYIRDLVGIDFIAIGGDYDGFMTPPVGLEHAGKMQNLVKALRDAGYRKDDIDKILGLNFMRVLKKAEKVAKALQ